MNLDLLCDPPGILFGSFWASKGGLEVKLCKFLMSLVLKTKELRLSRHITASRSVSTAMKVYATVCPTAQSGPVLSQLKLERTNKHQSGLGPVESGLDSS